MPTNVLQKIDDASELTAQDVYGKLVNNQDFATSVVKVDNSTIPFSIDPTVIRNLKGRTAFSVDDEESLAIAIHKALIPARQASLALIRDNGVWAWIGLYELREYVLIRWCGATAASMLPTSPDRCSYFLTNDGLARQARCGVRRLWIAANASHAARGNYGAVKANLSLTDLYTGVFERMIGLDAELACLITSELHKSVYTEDIRRRALIGIGARLSTVALECLDAGQKGQLITEVIADVQANPGILK
jgi:hypothetical protein